MFLGGADTRVPVEDFLSEAVVAQAQQQAPAFRQAHLVLQEEAGGVLGFQGAGGVVNIISRIIT